MGLLSILLIIFFMIDPERGMSDGAQMMAPSTSWKIDAQELVNNKSFVLATAGFTCVTFSVGRLGQMSVFNASLPLALWKIHSCVCARCFLSDELALALLGKSNCYLMDGT